MKSSHVTIYNARVLWVAHAIVTLLVLLVVVLTACVMYLKSMNQSEEQIRMGMIRELMDERICFLSAAMRAHKSGKNAEGIIEVLLCEKVAPKPAAIEAKKKNSKLT